MLTAAPSFFANGRRKWYVIHKIKVHGQVYDEHSAMKAAIAHSYKNLYHEDCPFTPLLDEFLTIQSVLMMNMGSQRNRGMSFTT